MPKDKTNFPKSGDNQKISLRNSNYPQFDYGYASRLRDDYPSIWRKGGNIRGNSAFTNWGKARGGSDSGAVLDWIKEREAWSARHFKNKNIAGVVAQIKWGTVGSRGERYMKDLVNEAKKKVDKDKSGDFTMEIKQMTVSFDVKEAEKQDDGFFHIKGYANTYEVDLGADETQRGAFQNSIASMKANAMPVSGTEYSAMIPSLWQHNDKEPIGTYVDMKEDERGLFVHAIYPMDDDFVRGRVVPQVKVRSVCKMSIGYVAKGYEFEERDGQTVRKLNEIDLREVSLVTFPMNEGALITDMKAKELGVDDFKDMTLRDIDKVLRNGVKMTRNGTKKFLSCLDVDSLRDAEKDVARDAEKGIVEEYSKMLDTIKKI